jgi:dolichyl-phosphate beta-glucosyltransferase
VTAAEQPGEPSGAPPDLSVVIPAFNEEHRLPAAIEAVTRYVNTLQGRAEVVIVENGSSDRTAQLADDAAKSDSRFRALHLPAPGKGGAAWGASEHGDRNRFL